MHRKMSDCELRLFYSFLFLLSPNIGGKLGSFLANSKMVVQIKIKKKSNKKEINKFILFFSPKPFVLT